VKEPVWAREGGVATVGLRVTGWNKQPGAATVYVMHASCVMRHGVAQGVAQAWGLGCSSLTEGFMGLCGAMPYCL